MVEANRPFHGDQILKEVFCAEAQAPLVRKARGVKIITIEINLDF